MDDWRQSDLEDFLGVTPQPPRQAVPLPGWHVEANKVVPLLRGRFGRAPVNAEAIEAALRAAGVRPPPNRQYIPTLIAAWLARDWLVRLPTKPNAVAAQKPYRFARRD